jgi:beta-galactosidase
MKKIFFTVLLNILLGFLIFSLENAAADQPRERLLLDSGWRFQLGDPPDVLTNSAETNVTYYPEIPNLEKLETDEITGVNSETNLATLTPDPVATHMGENVSVVQTNFDDSAWQAINLPHDWVVSLPFDSTADMGHGYKLMINGTNSPTTVGWYRHTFTLPSCDTNKTMWLEFDGAYRNCLVWFNGHILGRHVSGYTSFSFDVSPYVNPGGTNVLVVRVDASRFEGWFYEGAGIYRHVWLVGTDPLHVAHWGTYVTNLVNGSNAVVIIQTQVNNDGANAATGNLTSAILDPDGNLVASASQAINLAASTNQTISQSVTVTNARLWSLNSPSLYKLVSIVTQGTITNDIYQTPFGIRTIKWDPNNGLLLNGQRVELQGMCNHQDHAGVGIAVPDRIQYYRVERLKEMGCNTYRTSHNSPDPALLDACDQLGMLVLDENRRVGTDPETLGEVQSHVMRDRNHPCVFAWSLGNEEIYIQGSSTGASIIQTMQRLANQIDPSRLCTVAQNGSWGSGFTAVIEVQGYNYRQWGDEDAIHASFPNLPSFSTEEGSTEAARDIYTDTSTYKRNYDNEPTHTYTIEQLWQYYLARPWLAGLCIWTGFDYRGEPTPFSWPNISSQYGPMDTCGFAKDIFYYYQANWAGKPVLHILPHWNWTTPGQNINIWVYSDCDLVELFLNGVSQGRQTNDVLSHLEWNLPYAAGTLEAIGYIDGQAVITNMVTTTGTPAAINLQPDRQTILADGRDVSLVTVSVVDAQGRVVPTATNTINFTINGGNIIGLGNGDPIDHESDQPTNNAGLRSAFNGLAQVIVQSTNQAGVIHLTATATGLASANAAINMAANLPAPDAPAAPVAIASGSQVWLSWDIVPGAITYNLKRATTSDGPYVTIVSNTASLFYIDTNVVNGATYYYALSAVNNGGEGSNSVASIAIPHIVPPMIISQPDSFTNTHSIYAGVPATFSILAYGDQPIYYQWYEVTDGITNAIAGATNASYTYLAENNDTNTTEFSVIASNGASNVISSTAFLYNVQGPPVIVKSSTITMNNGGDWSPNTVPTSSYIGEFDDTISSSDEGAFALGNNITLGGLLFINNLNGPVNISGNNVLTIDNSGLNGWPGIDMSIANQNVALNCALVLKGSQAWNVIPGRTLTIGGTLTTTGAGVDFSSFLGNLGVLGNVNGILGPWATIDSGGSMNYATESAGIIGSYSGGTMATTNNLTDETSNYILTNALALSTSSEGNTLQYAGNTQTLSLGANTLTLNGLLNSGNGILTLSGTAALTIGPTKELVIADNSQAIDVACPIADNPVGTSSLTYNGIAGGTLTLNPNSSSSTSDNASTFTGNVVINSGIVSLQKQVNINATTGVTSSPLGNRILSGRTITINAGAGLSFDVGNELGRGAGPTFPQMTIVVNSGGTVRSTASNRTLGPIVLNGGTLSIANVNTTQYEPFGFSSNVIVSGTSPSAISAVAGGGINLTAGAAANTQRIFNVADVTGDASIDLTVSAMLANTSGNANTAAGLVKSGAGTMDLTAPNIYTGATTVNDGTLLIDGSLGASDVTVNSGGILEGSGSIGGPVTVQPGGTIQPGHGGVDTSTMAISNILTLAGNTVLNLNRTNVQTASKITGITTLTRGGTLTVNDIGGPLQAGDTFTLFSAQTYMGSFNATNLPVLQAGLSWSNNIIGNAFTIMVIGRIMQPTITSVNFSSGNLILNGTNGLAGQQYRILSTTNLLLPITSWIPVETNSFGMNGSYTNSIPINQFPSTSFFRLVTP